MSESSLDHLFGAYFHQDYLATTGDEVETVSIYLKENSDDVASLIAQLTQLRTADATEKELGDLADHAGCAIDPTLVGETWREWFASIEAQARAFAAAHPQADG